MSDTLVDVAEAALREAHGDCQEYGTLPGLNGPIENCPYHGEAWATVQHAKASPPRFTEADMREAIRLERDRYDATVTHPDAEEEVLARLREIQTERETPRGTT